MKRTLITALCLLLTLGLLAGCQGGDAEGSGGAYRQLYSGEVTTLNYLATNNNNELVVAANCVDGLVDYDSFGKIVPGLAESWTHNDDFTVWTFKLRKGVKWVDNAGKKVADVTAQDWVTAAQFVNEAVNDSSMQYMYADGIVKNAQEYYEQTGNVLAADLAVEGGEFATVEEYYAANEIDPATFITADDIGVKAIDDLTLEYTCAKPIPYFLTVLSYSCYFPVNKAFLEEWGAAFGTDSESMLYNGAYVLAEFEPQNHRTFKKNQSYWDKEHVYIDELHYIYNAESTTISPTMFERGEIDYAEIGADILDQWLKDDATKDLVRGNRLNNSYSYFFAFNFEPRFDASYEPDNWMIAVNNENFRKAVAHSIDRVKALAVSDPIKPAARLNNTITPANFATAGGKDFVEFAPLAPFTNSDSFDEAKATSYRDAAKAELTAAGATFPIKVLMPFSPSTTNWDKECQVVEQQVEALLGSDFIDIIIEAGPSTGFLSEIRRSGKYALMRCNYGADYADPQTWTDAFTDDNTYNFMYTSEDKVLSDIPAINKTPETQAIVAEYYRLTGEAKAITQDIEARYNTFAAAEAHLLEHAILIPYSLGESNYVASRLNPFEGQYAPYGLALLRYKGQRLLEKPMSMTEFDAAYATWETAWNKAIAEEQK